LANSEKNQAEYDFAGIRYPPPLLQRRSCDTDHNKRDKWPSTFLRFAFSGALNVCERVARTARMRIHKAGAHASGVLTNGNAVLHAGGVVPKY